MNKTLKATSIILVITLFLGTFLIESPASYAAKKVKKPAKVTGVKAKAKGNRITVSWKKAKHAVKYRIYVKKPGSRWKVWKKRVKTRKQTLTAKKSGKYCFMVKGINRKGKLGKKNSKKISVTIKVDSTSLSKADRFLRLSGKNSIVVTQYDYITLKVLGSGAKDAIWTFPGKYFLVDGLDREYGPKLKRFVFKPGAFTIKIHAEDGDYSRTLNVKVVVKEFKSKTITVDGCIFEDRSDYFGRTFRDGIDVNDSDSPYVVSYYFNTEEGAVIDPAKVKIKIDGNDEKTYYTTDSKIRKGKPTCREDLYRDDFYIHYTQKGVIAKYLGAINVDVVDASVIDPEEGMYLDVDIISYSKTERKRKVQLYYSDTLIDEFYWIFEKRNYSWIDEYKEKCWAPDMTVKEKLDAVAKYICENYTYAQADCRAAERIAILARYEFGLNTWIQMQETSTGYSTYISEGISLRGSGITTGHRVAVVEIDNQLYGYHVQGGSAGYSGKYPIYPEKLTSFPKYNYNYVELSETPI